MRQFLLTIVAAAGLLLPPAIARGQNINMSADDHAPNDCANLNVRFDDRPAIRAEQSLTVRKSQGFVKMTAPRHGGIRVRGANRGDILVRVCKAVPEQGQDGGSAQLDRIVGAVSGDTVTVTGPALRR